MLMVLSRRLRYIISTSGGIISSVPSVLQRMCNTVEEIICTVRHTINVERYHQYMDDVQLGEGYHQQCGEYRQCCGGYSLLWGRVGFKIFLALKIDLFLNKTHLRENWAIIIFVFDTNFHGGKISFTLKSQFDHYHQLKKIICC